MQYICIDSVDWGDEFDVDFAEILNEEEYQKYSYAKKILKSFEIHYGFGTNEAFEDLDVLSFEFSPIPEDHLRILKLYGFPNGHSFIDNFYEQLETELINVFPEDCCEQSYSWNPSHKYTTLKHSLSECSFKDFKYYIDKYAKYLKN